MSFKHAEMMHDSLFNAGVMNTCMATSLDGILQRHDIHPDFYHNIATFYGNDTDEDVEGFTQLLKDEALKVFRSDHSRFEHIGDLFVVPSGDPATWDPESPYEEFDPDTREYRRLKRHCEMERDRVYSFRIDGESEESRVERANSAFEDAQSRIGAFIVAKNVLLDGANLIPIHNQTLDGSTHAVGIARGLGAPIEELHSIGVSTDVTGREHLVKSPATTLMALCGITLREPEEDSYGNCYPMLTDNTVQVGPDKWGYAFFTFPPEK